MTVGSSRRGQVRRLLRGRKSRFGSNTTAGQRHGTDTDAAWTWRRTAAGGTGLAGAAIPARAQFRCPRLA